MYPGECNILNSAMSGVSCGVSRRRRRLGQVAHVLGRRVLQDGVQDAGPVEPGNNREPPGNGGGLESGQVGSHCQPQLVSERHMKAGEG
jgi:hypothetical protein